MSISLLQYITLQSSKSCCVIYITLSNCLVLRLIIAVIIPSFIHLELLNSQSEYIYYSHALGPVYPIASELHGPEAIIYRSQFEEEY